jgi:hypothetical protein
MDDNDRRMISFQASAKELETIEERARKRGLSRSEYIRTRTTIDPEQSPESDLEALVKHGIYLTNQV